MPEKTGNGDGEKVIILGIDPGFGIVGYGVLSSVNGVASPLGHGVITTDSSMPLPARLEVIYRDMHTLIDHFKPDAAAVEELFFQHNQTTVIAVAEARGVILLALREKGVAIYEYTPMQVKMAVTGYGKATKKQMQEMTRLRLRLPEIPKPDDAADALAIALTLNGASPLGRRPL